MAEAFLKKMFPDRFEAFSAGTEPSNINPFVVKTMAELDYDLSKNSTKSVKDFFYQYIDLVVTVCEGAKEACPFFPGAKKYIHKSFPDPSNFNGSEEEILNKVREVRDEIRKWLEKTFGDLHGERD